MVEKIIPGKIDAVDDQKMWWEDDIITVSYGRFWLLFSYTKRVKVQRPHSFRKGNTVKIVLDEAKRIISMENMSERRTT